MISGSHRAIADIAIRRDEIAGALRETPRVLACAGDATNAPEL